MNKIIKFNKLIEYIIGTIFVVLIVVVTAQVVWRYILQLPLPWASELSQYLLVWLSFLGAALAVKRKAHLGVKYFVQLLPNKLKYYLEVVVSFIIIVFCIILFFAGTSLTIKSMSNLSPTLKLPMGFVYLSIPLSAIMMIYYIIFDIKGLLKGNDGK